MTRGRRLIAVGGMQVLEHVVLAHAAALPLVPDLGEDGLRGVQGAALRRLAGDDRAQQSPGAHEGLFRIEPLEQRHQAVEVARRRRLAADPAPEADLVDQTLHVGEDFELSAVAEPIDAFLHGGIHLGDESLHAFGGEQVAEEAQVARQQFARQLEADERARRLGETRHVLGKLVQAAQTVGRKQEEQTEAEQLEQERVAMPFAHSGQEAGRVAQKRHRRAEQGRPCHTRRRRGDQWLAHVRCLAPAA